MSVKTFKQIYDLFAKQLESLGLLEKFEQTFSYKLWKETKLCSFSLPPPDQYLSIFLTSVDECGYKMTPLEKDLLKIVLPAATLRKNGVKKVKPVPVTMDLTSKTDCDKRLSQSIESKKQKCKSLLPVPISVPIEKVAKIREISEKTREKVKKDLSSYRWKTKTLYKMCGVESCNKCIRLFENVPLTKCTHSKPCNDSGLYPHLSRTGFKAYHNDGAPIESCHCASKHWRNPLATGGLLDVVTTAIPLSSGNILQPTATQESCTYDSKKRKLDDGIVGKGTQSKITNPSPKMNDLCPCGATLKRNAKRKWTCSVLLCPTWAEYAYLKNKHSL